MRLREKQASVPIRSRHFDLHLNKINSSSSAEVMVCDWDTYYMQCSGAGGWDPIDPGFGCCMGQVCYTSYNQNNTDSDGFINAVSQKGDLLGFKPISDRIDNVNHISMTRSVEVRNAIQNSFNGLYGPSWSTSQR